MTLEEYYSIYGDKYKEYLGTTESNLKRNERGIVILDCGMILFTKESAPSWGGPFPGNYAHYLIMDYRKGWRWNPKDKHDKSLSILVTQEYIDNQLKKHISGKEHHDIRDALVSHYTHEYPSVMRPFRVYMMGNDDTSYSCTFETEELAREHIALLKACEPIDLHKDIQPNYAFTN